MFEMPTQEQIDKITRKAQAERARFMRDCVRWTGRQIAFPFRLILDRPTERRT